MDFPVKLYKALIWLTLYASALHFFDNVYFFNQYPEPAWLTAPLVAMLWIPIALLAHRAVDCIYTGKMKDSYALIHSFVSANFLSLGHYFFESPSAILPRINHVIFLQVAMASVLFLYTLWLQYSRSPDTFRFARRVWLENIMITFIAACVFEYFWPSHWDNWWYS